MGALLWKIQLAVQLGHTCETPTDVACRWNVMDWENVNPDTISNIQFYSEAGKACVQKGVSRRIPPEPPTEGEKADFLLKLKQSASNQAVGLSLFESTVEDYIPKESIPKPKRLPPSLVDLFSKDSLDNVHDLIKVSPADVDYVEESTRMQSNSVEWYSMRCGRITSSVVHDVTRTNQSNPAPSLIKRICNNKPSIINTEPIKWGRNKESVAKSSYLQCMSSRHEDFKLRESGLVLHPNMPYLGASPDGTISCSCCNKGTLEIKCPYNARFMTIDEMIQTDSSCLDINSQLKTNHRYYNQVQHQIFVTQSNYADFMVWTVKEAAIVRITPDSEWVKSIPPILKNFWESHIVTALKSRYEDTPGTSAMSTSYSHCICGKQDRNPMIGCDNENCPNQWFHWNCVGIRKDPKSNVWYCKNCRK